MINALCKILHSLRWRNVETEASSRRVPNDTCSPEGTTFMEYVDTLAVFSGPGSLNRFSASLSGVSAGVRLPCGWAAG